MTDDELDAVIIRGATKAMQERKPYSGMKVRHVKSGGVYVVVTVGLVEATLAPVVIYRDIVAHTTWVRPVDEFCDGRFVGI